MFNEKATMFLSHLFDFRVSFIKTIQPAGLTASGLSLLPVALRVSSLPTCLLPLPFQTFLGLTEKQRPAQSCHPGQAGVPGLGPQLPPASTPHGHPAASISPCHPPATAASIAFLIVHHSEDSLPPGAWKHAGPIRVVSNEPEGVTGAQCPGECTAQTVPKISFPLPLCSHHDFLSSPAI